MNRGASLIAAGALIALAGPLASPAGAAAPRGDCPPPFQFYDYAAQIDLAQEVLGLREEDATALVDETNALIDRNGDQALCYAFQNRHTGEPNVIDNTRRSS